MRIAITKFIYNGSRVLRRFGFDFREALDPRVKAMQQRIDELGNINFEIQVDPDGKWVAESTNIDGIITGGNEYPKDFSENLKDAVFTYFEIPPHLCNDSLLRHEGEAAHVRQRVYA